MKLERGTCATDYFEERTYVSFVDRLFSSINYFNI
jgi:hypothetical protein